MTEVTWRRVERWCGWLALVLSTATVVAGLWLTPSERVLGRKIAILYPHVGAAWTTYLAGGVTALAALVYLRRRSSRWDHLAVAGVEAGLWLSTVTLVTGSLWARGTQGWWWRWDDPRLVLTLFLWFLYAGYLTLRQFTDGERRARLSAVLALLGLPVMVLNHFALTLWQPRFHPAPVLGRAGGPAASPQFLWILGLSLLTFTLLLIWMLLGRARLEALRDAMAA